MAFRIASSDFDDITSILGKSKDVSSSGDLHRIVLPDLKGDIVYNEQILGHHLSILQSNYVMTDDVIISGKGESSLLEIQFNLSDRDIFYKSKDGKEHIAPGRSGNISYLSAEENQAEILFRKGLSYDTFDVHLPVSLLNQYEGESKTLDTFLNLIQKDISCQLLSKSIRVSPGIYNTINHIKNCTFEGLTRRVYLESKIFELIAMLYAEFENEQHDFNLSAADRERILWAASLIQENLNHSFTILELSRTVGINQTKLKTGFKSIFGHTVFGYLQEIRMEQAKTYLLDTSLSVHEIGLLLGYQNTSNFSVAFKKVHGFSPIRLRDNNTRKE
ncbi:helix-turn-helix domain-containing protein [Desertivirga xinjiangensis]|uniref:helix-turn-helix domain-containing protein n=1 Tax=Desertivirga xinjiangensis TaxID=539206 RepID=UPI00210BFA44|nr:helix-turn-helix domain-containing protein [Pedobacter xinjiangensis]